jgi:hypothetical protein
MTITQFVAVSPVIIIFVFIIGGQIHTAVRTMRLGHIKAGRYMVGGTIFQVVAILTIALYLI